MILKLFRLIFPEARINVPEVEVSEQKTGSFASFELPSKRFQDLSQERLPVKRKKVEQEGINLKKTLKDAEKLLNSPGSNRHQSSVTRRKFEISDTDQESLKKTEKTGEKTEPLSDVAESQELLHETRKSQKRLKNPKKTDSLKPRRKTLAGLTCKPLTDPTSRSFSLPKGIITELPRSKQQLKHLQVIQNDDTNTKLSKLFQAQNLGRLYSNSNSFTRSCFQTSSKSSKNLERLKEIQMKASQDLNSVEADSRSVSDKHSNLTDSFLTPEDSPLLTASPESSKISAFQLESPISQLRSDLPSAGWGKTQPTTFVASPFFPDCQESRFEVRPNVLFSPFSPILEDRPEQKPENEGLEKFATSDMMISRENSLDPGSEGKENSQVLKEKLQNSLNQPFFSNVSENGNFSGFSSTTGRSFITENKFSEIQVLSTVPSSSVLNPFKSLTNASLPEPPVASPSISATSCNTLSLNPSSTPEVPSAGSSIQSSPNPFLNPGKSPVQEGQFLNPSLVLNSSSSNPFLNISQATVSTPKYQFGKGGSVPLAKTDAGINPFTGTRF